MAIIKQVIHGQVTLDDSQATQDVTLSSAIDLSKSYLLFGVESSDDAPSTDWVSGQVIDATTLRFSRAAVQAGDAPAIVRYHLLEFESGVVVQRGVQSSLVAGNNDVTLSSAVDLTRAIGVLSASNLGNATDGDDFIQLSLPLTDTLRLNVNTAPAVIEIPWQVIEFTDSAVQTGTVNFSTSDSVQTVTLTTTVDAAKSWLSLSYASDAGTGADIGQKLVRGELSTDGTTLTFTRENTGQALELIYFLVEFTDNTNVQRGTVTLSDTELETLIPLSPVDPELAVPTIAGLYDRTGSTAYASDDVVGVASVRLQLLGGGTTLAIRRGTLGTPATAMTVAWQVIAFEPAATVIYSSPDDIIQVQVQGSVNQTQALQTWEKNDGQVVARVTPEGRLQAGDMGSTGDAIIEAYRTNSAELPERGIGTFGLLTSLLSSTISWFLSELVVDTVDDVSGILRAMRAKLTFLTTGDATNADVRGSDVAVVNQSGESASPVQRLTGIQAFVDNQGDAHADEINGASVLLQNGSNSSIETARGLEVQATNNQGTIATLIGVDIADVDDGTDNYAIRTGKGAVQLGDVVEMMPVSAAPAAKAGLTQFYSKTDGKLYAKDPNDVEYDLTQTGGGGGGGPHTHTLAEITDAGTMAAQNSNFVYITGGAIDGDVDLTGDKLLIRSEGFHGFDNTVFSNVAYPQTFVNRARGTLSLPTAVQNGDVIGTYLARAVDGTNLFISGGLESRASSNWTPTTRNAYLNFLVSAGSDVAGHLAARLEPANALTLFDKVGTVIGEAFRSKLYSEGGELKAIDATGYITTLSSHNPQLFDASERPTSYVHAEKNPFTGTYIEMDTFRALQLLEQLTGETLIHIQDLPAEELVDWDANESRLVAERELERQVWQSLPEDKRSATQPEIYTPRPEPQQMRQARQRRKRQ